MRAGSHVFIDAEGSGTDVVPTLNFQSFLMNMEDCASIMEQLSKNKR